MENVQVAHLLMADFAQVVSGCWQGDTSWLTLSQTWESRPGRPTENQNDDFTGRSSLPFMS